MAAVGSGLKGSFPLTKDGIEAEIKHIAPGVFALGNLVDDRFKTLLVGRSDKDLKQELLRRIGQTKRFKYLLYDDAEDAFKKECELYHFLKPYANKGHPQRPQNRTWTCPDCHVYTDVIR